MNIADLARAHATLTGVVGFPCMEAPIGLQAVCFSFEGQAELWLLVNPEDDSLSWGGGKPSSSVSMGLEKIFPEVRKAYGLQLTWAWEMTNHQGYFDAVQIQLADESLQREVAFQFKAIASVIQVFEISRLHFKK